MRRTKEEAELTRTALLDAALKVFSRKGYSETRLEDVAEAAGVTRGAIYHHFGGKAELFASLMEESSQIGSQAVGRAIQEGGAFLDIARRVLVYSLQLVVQDAHYREVTALLLMHSGSSPELAPLQRLQVERGIAQIAQVASFFQMGQQQGALRADLDPEIAARAFLAYQNGLVQMLLLAPNVIDVETQSQALADVLLRGMLPK